LLAQVMLKLDKYATCAKFKPLNPFLARVMLKLDKYVTCAKFPCWREFVTRANATVIR
jgi:hypothetical protein